MTKNIIFKYFVFCILSCLILNCTIKKLLNFLVPNYIILLSLPEILKLIRHIFIVTIISLRLVIVVRFILIVLNRLYAIPIKKSMNIEIVYYIFSFYYIHILFNYKINNITRRRHKYNTPITYFYYN